MEGTVSIKHKGIEREVPVAEWQAVLDQLVAEHGAWEAASSVVFHPATEAPAPEAETPASEPLGVVVPLVSRTRSTWEHQVMDESAKARIEEQDRVLREQGINVDRGRQLYASGNRMADSGYQTQRSREEEHLKLFPLRDVTGQLSGRIESEKRRNQVVTAKDFAAKLAMNGSLTFDGYKLQEQALRGLFGRLKSPATGYVLGVSERMLDEQDPAMLAIDRASILDTVEREARRNPERLLNLRLRDGLGDIFATVGPDYGVADAPAVMPEVLDALAGYPNVRATYSYDPTSTSWEIRAQVHTPTPVEEQAVGEAFQGYVTIRSRDNGTGGLNGGGGILLIACLNASVYAATGHGAYRTHRKNILVDLQKMVAEAARNIHAICLAWGVAREDVIALPTDQKGGLIPIEQAIPGFYRFSLNERKGDLVGVLPGRSEVHAGQLAKAYFDERRNRESVTRADLANGLTRYIQGQSAPVQQVAEVAIGRWLVKRGPVQYLEA